MVKNLFLTKNEIEIELPFFTGFYESRFDRMDEEFLEFETNDYSPEFADVFSRHYSDFIDYDSAKKKTCEKLVSNFENKLKDSKLVKSVKFHLLDSPREYNFRTDKIFIKVKNLNISKLLKYIKQEYEKELFRKHLVDVFGDRSGFVSFISSSLNDFFNTLNQNEDKLDDNHLCFYLTEALHFYLDREENYEEEDLWDEIRSSDIIDDFVDYDGLSHEMCKTLGLPKMDYEELKKAIIDGDKATNRDCRLLHEAFLNAEKCKNWEDHTLIGKMLERMESNSAVETWVENDEHPYSFETFNEMIATHCHL